jgi:hypothetical protein
MFGVENLLNVQPGGFNAMYSPGEEQFHQYTDFHPNFFTVFEDTATQALQMKKELEDWLKTISLNVKSISLTDMYLDTVIS